MIAQTSLARCVSVGVRPVEQCPRQTMIGTPRFPCYICRANCILNNGRTGVTRFNRKCEPLGLRLPALNSSAYFVWRQSIVCPPGLRNITSPKVQSSQIFRCRTKNSTGPLVSPTKIGCAASSNCARGAPSAGYETATKTSPLRSPLQTILCVACVTLYKKTTLKAVQAGRVQLIMSGNTRSNCCGAYSLFVFRARRGTG
jgi:hypothetical protein